MRLAAAEIVPIRYGAYGRALTRELELLRRDSLRDRRAFAAATAGGVSIGPGSSAAVEAHKRPALSPDFGPPAKAIAALRAQGDAPAPALQRIEEPPDEERRKSA